MNHVVRRVAPPVLLAFVATGLVAPPAGAAPTWVAPAVTLAEGTVSRPPADSHVVVDAAGNAIVMWVDLGSGDESRVLVSTHPVGGPWSPPLDISGTGDIADEVDLATNAAGHAVAVWTRGNGTNDVLETATRLTGGGWSAPVPVGDPTADSEAPQVVVDASGNAVVLWISGLALRAATRPAGGTWSAADDVSDPAEGLGLGTYDLVVTPGGQATAAWTQYLTVDDRVIKTAVRPAGGTFGDPQTISAGDEEARSPQVAVNAAGVATATWVEETETIDSDVKAATRAPDGTWSSVEDASAAGGDNDSPDVVVDGAGTATAVWTRWESGQPGRLLSSSRPAGGTWSAPQDLTPPATGVTFHEVALAIDPSDRITAVYDVFPGTVPGSVVTASTRAPGEPWSAAVPLSPSGDGFIAEPEVAMDDAGQATVIWLRTEAPPGYVLETRSLDTQAPLASGLSLPAATVGTPVTLSWAAIDAWSPIASVAWTFSDGGTGSGSSVTRSFAAVGSYAVSVTATDAAGYATTLTGTVVVSPAPPVTPAPPPAPLPKPILSQVKLTKKTIHVVGSDENPRATRLKLGLNTDATVVVKLKRTGKVDGKTVKAKLSKAMKSGQQAIRLTTKVGGKLLVAGTYRITVRATNAVGSSAARTVKLKVLS